MKDEFLQLKEYLTKEYMKMSEEKDDIISKKVQLEVERDKEENPLFSKKGTEEIKRMFSPLSDNIFRNLYNEKKKSELCKKIEMLENNANNINTSMEEVKKYITFVKSMERQWIEEETKKTISDLPADHNFHKQEAEVWQDKKENIQEEDKYREYNGNEVEDDAKAMIVAAIQFIESEYPNIHFYMDIEEENYILSSEANSNLIRIITYTISSTIESMVVDSVWIEMKRKNNDMIISLQLVGDGGLIGHYAYKTSLTIV